MEDTKGKVLYEVWVDYRDHEIYDALREFLFRQGVLPKNSKSCFVDFALRFLALSLLRLIGELRGVDVGAEAGRGEKGR